MKTTNSHDSKDALLLVWERLDRYVRPENMESVIRQKLAASPKLSKKENCKLYDSFDLVSEIQALKNNQLYSSLFG
jgi:hypothetical protein